MSVGPWQIAIIALVVLLLFGATRLADIGKGLGEGIKNFKKGISEDPDDEADSKKAQAGDPKQLKPNDESEPATAAAPADKEAPSNKET